MLLRSVRVEVGNQRLQELSDLVLGAAGIGRAGEGLDASDRPVGEQSVARPQHLRVIRREYVLGRKEHFLVQLLTRAHTSELDLDVSADLEAGQANQVGGDVHHFDLFAHVENEHLSTASESPSLKYQLNRFGNGHEVAAHFGVRHRHRPAGADLTEEGRHDAAAAAKNVSESHRDEIAVVLRRRVLHELLGDSLRRSHHARRPHRLVGRDKHEVLDVCLDRSVNDVPRAGDVVGYRFENVVFHQGHVLVCGRVEDSMRIVLLEDVEDPVAVTDVGDHRYDVHVRERQQQFLEYVEDRVLAVAEDNQARRREARDLATQLGADRPAGTGNENRLARGQLGHCGEVSLDCVASQQILNLDFAEAGGVALSRDDLGKAWHRASRNSAAQRRAHYLTNHRSRRGRHCDDDLSYAEALDNLGDVRKRTEYRQAGEHVTVLRCIAVNEADRLESELRGGEELLYNELASVAGARDQHSLAALVSPPAERARTSDSHHQARQRDKSASEQGINEDDGEGDSGRREMEHRQNY